MASTPLLANNGGSLCCSSFPNHLPTPTISKPPPHIFLSEPSPPWMMEPPPESPRSSQPRMDQLPGSPSPVKADKDSSKLQAQEGKPRRRKVAAITATPQNFSALVQELTGVQHFTGYSGSDDISSELKISSIVSSGKERTISRSERVLQWLADPAVSMVGIYGMGGVGKTTFVTHIQNRLRNDPIMYFVSLVTVPRKFSIHKLQDDIARTLDIDLSDEDDNQTRMEKLSRALVEKNTILILDDLWEHIPLEEVGIPTSSDRCKLIFTTRFSSLCLSMSCQKVIAMVPLSSEESWELFMEKIGPGIIFPAPIEQIAKLIVKECSGLPFAIILMAGALKEVVDEGDLGEWIGALGKIKKRKVVQDHDMRSKMFYVLRYCYDKLKEPSVQQCLQYCANYPEEFKIDREMLIENFIDAGFIDAPNGEAEFSNGHAALDRLENAFLLEGGTSKYGKRCVKMNNLVREFLHSLTSTTFPFQFGNRIPDDSSHVVVIPEDKDQFTEVLPAEEAGTTVELNCDESSSRS